MMDIGMDKFLKQMEDACDIALFMKLIQVVLSWTKAGHHKFDDQALIAKKILVKDGGLRGVWDTTWANQP